MKFGETSIEAIQRELQEEMGVTIENPQLFALIENFFDMDQAVHELLFVFQGKLPIKEVYTAQVVDSEVITWLPIAEIAQLKPIIFQELVRENNQNQFHHLINQE